MELKSYLAGKHDIEYGASIGPGGIEINDGVQVQLYLKSLQSDRVELKYVGLYASQMFSARLQSDRVELKWGFGPPAHRHLAASIGPGGIEIGLPSTTAPTTYSFNRTGWN